ncbi:MAG TPA: ETC complex I subunit [Alphaproteobacteria bacterium]|jgi:hypothetical protein
MPKVQIYQPSRTAMQQGEATTRHWVLEFEPASPRTRDPLMGWTSSADTRGQVQLRFPTREAAVAYAERNGLDYRLIEPKPRRPRIKSYADNFRYDRVE